MIHQSKACALSLARSNRTTPALARELHEVRGVAVGDRVAWTNASPVVETGGGGEVVHLWGDHAVIFNAEVARRYPHLNPYAIKRIGELRITREALAA